jgi:DNA-binding NtrC family response regulator
MERLAVLTEGKVIDVGDLPPEVTGGRSAGDLPPSAERGPLAAQLRALKARAVGEALAACDHNQTRAAALLGIKQSNLSRLMKSLGLR